MQRLDEAGVRLIRGDGVHALHDGHSDLRRPEDGLVIAVGDALDDVQLLRAAAERGEVRIGQAHLAQAHLAAAEEEVLIVAERRGDAGTLATSRTACMPVRSPRYMVAAVAALTRDSRRLMADMDHFGLVHLRAPLTEDALHGTDLDAFVVEGLVIHLRARIHARAAEGGGIDEGHEGRASGAQAVEWRG
jgi:hypothetical protein